MEKENPFEFIENPDGTYQVKGVLEIPNFVENWSTYRSINLGKNYKAFQVFFIDSKGFDNAKLNLVVDFVDKYKEEELIFTNKVSLINKKQGKNLNAKATVVTCGIATECYLEFDIKVSDIEKSDYIEKGSVYIKFLFSHVLVYPKQNPMTFEDLLKPLNVSDIGN